MVNLLLLSTLPLLLFLSSGGINARSAPLKGSDLNEFDSFPSNDVFKRDAEYDVTNTADVTDVTAEDDVKVLLEDLSVEELRAVLALYESLSQHSGEAAQAIKGLLGRGHSVAAMSEPREKRYVATLFRLLLRAIKAGVNVYKVWSRTQALNRFMSKLTKYGSGGKGDFFKKRGNYNTALDDFNSFQPDRVSSFSNSRNGITGKTGYIGDTKIQVRNGSSSTSGNRPTLEIIRGSEVHKVRYDP